MCRRRRHGELQRVRRVWRVVPRRLRVVREKNAPGACCCDLEGGRWGGPQKDCSPAETATQDEEAERAVGQADDDEAGAGR